jgi:hypothetical protein
MTSASAQLGKGPSQARYLEAMPDFAWLAKKPFAIWANG